MYLTHNIIVLTTECQQVSFTTFQCQGNLCKFYPYCIIIQEIPQNMINIMNHMETLNALTLLISALRLRGIQTGGSQRMGDL